MAEKHCDDDNKYEDIGLNVNNKSSPSQKFRKKTFVNFLVCAIPT